MNNTLNKKIEDLEIDLALAQDLLEHLSDQIAKMNQALDLQQAQLRYLYKQLPEKNINLESFDLADDIPPHY